LLFKDLSFLKRTADSKKGSFINKTLF